MTLEEKQPDWIDKARHHYLYAEEYGFPYPKEIIEEDEKIPNIIESKRAFREAINEHLPQEDTYQKGYQKGRSDLKEKIEQEIKVIRGIDIRLKNVELIGRNHLLTIVSRLEYLLSPTDTK